MTILDRSYLKNGHIKTCFDNKLFSIFKVRNFFRKNFFQREIKNTKRRKKSEENSLNKIYE